MKCKPVARVVTFILVATLVTMPAFAVLGVGDIVYDPTNYAQALDRFAQLQKQLQQLVQTYTMIRNQYDQMLWMAQRVPVDMLARYRAVFSPWALASATNTYGTTGGWITAVNSGTGILPGYNQSIIPLQAYGAAFGNIPADQAGHIKSDYATVELTDGANLLALQTIGNVRGNAPQVERTIQNLEQDSLSADPAMNTEIAVLNKINAANVISLRNTQDSNQLLASLAEQQLIDAKRKRDAEAQAINEHIQFMGAERGILAAQSSDASQAMLAWRMP